MFLANSNDIQLKKDTNQSTIDNRNTNQARILMIANVKKSTFHLQAN